MVGLGYVGKQSTIKTTAKAVINKLEKSFLHIHFSLCTKWYSRSEPLIGCSLRPSREHVGVASSCGCISRLRGHVPRCPFPCPFFGAQCCIPPNPHDNSLLTSGSTPRLANCHTDVVASMCLQSLCGSSSSTKEDEEGERGGK